MSLLRALGPFVGTKKVGCELCGAPLEAEHAHVAETERRALLCACRACAMLFCRPGKWRTVPDRHVHDPTLTMTPAEWGALGIPVSTAFFFRSSAADRWLAVYPSAGGAVESLLPLDAFEAIVARSPLLQSMESDVEALLAGDHGERCLLVPIHTCYALIGSLRREGRGLEGGQRAVDAQLEAITQRCEKLS